MKGRIKKKTSRGFGFIGICQEKDLFFSCLDLKNVIFEDLEEGDLVSFEVEEGPEGPQAINVERAGKKEDNGKK